MTSMDLCQISKKKKKRFKPVHYHVVDLLNCQAQAAGLEACCEIRLQHRRKVNPLVKVIAFDLWQILWEITTGFQNSFCGDRRGLAGHCSVQK